MIPTLFRLDALTIVFLIVLALGLALTLALAPRSALKATAIAAVLALAVAALPLPLLAAGFVGAQLLAATDDRAAGWRRLLAAHAVPLLLLIAGLAVTALQSGVWRFGDPSLADGLTNVGFALLLLACAWGAGLLPPSSAPSLLRTLLLRPLWLYPFARLYELGPWNIGWGLAAVLLGGGIALVSSWSAPWADGWDERSQRVVTSLLAGALASLGFASGAGLAGGLLGVAAAVICAGALASGRRSPLLWLTAVPVPLTLPFAALWLQLGAAASGGTPVMTAVLWASAIGWSFAVLRSMTAGRRQPGGRLLVLLAVLSLCVGVVTPLVVRLLIVPAIFQLGAGVTPFGQPSLWPWLGLEIRAASAASVSTWRSLAVAGLTILLSAVAYLLNRLLSLRDATLDAAEPAVAEYDAVWARVRQNIPWLPRKDGQQ